MKLIFCEIKATRGHFFGYITGVTAKSEPQVFLDFKECVFEILKKTSSKKENHFFKKRDYFQHLLRT